MAGQGGIPSSLSNFEGFTPEKASGSDLPPLLLKKRVEVLETLVYELVDRVKGVELDNEKLKTEFKHENEVLKTTISQVNQQQESA